MTMRFGDVIIRVIKSAPKKVYKHVTYRLLVCKSFGRGEISGYYFCLIGHIWSLKLCDLSNSNS